MLIVMSNVAVDLPIDVSTDIIHGVRDNIGVDVLVVYVNVFVDVITAFGFEILDLLDVF